MEQKKCKLCGKMFKPRSAANTICSDKHLVKCPVCGKTVEWNHSYKIRACSKECKELERKKTMLKKYGKDSPLKVESIKQKYRNTMISRYGVNTPLENTEIFNSMIESNKAKYGSPYTLNTRSAQVDRHAEIEKSLRKRSIQFWKNYPYEGHVFDFYLVEYNTFIDSADSKNIEDDIISKVLDHKIRCIFIFDGDDIEKVLDILDTKRCIGARKCKLYKLDLNYTDRFLKDFDLQGTSTRNLLSLGLVYENTLMQCMTFGSTSSKEVELLRLCTRKGYRIQGGASRLLKWATEYFYVENIVAYCDRSKFSGRVFQELGFILDKHELLEDNPLGEDIYKLK